MSSFKMSSFSLTLFLFISIFFISTNANKCILGYPSGKLPNATISDLISSNSFFDKYVIVKGIITSSPDGHWIQVSDTKGNSIFVNSHVDWFTFPLDTINIEATIEGVFNLHYSTIHNPHNKLFNFPPLPVYMIEATAATIDGSCDKWPNVPFIQNLQKGSIHSPDQMMGCGYVCLSSGGTMKEHSNQHSSEIVTGTSGLVKFQIDRGGKYEEYNLGPLQSIYVPPHTPHQVSNPWSEKGCYIYCHASLMSNFSSLNF